MHAYESTVHRLLCEEYRPGTGASWRTIEQLLDSLLSVS